MGTEADTDKYVLLLQKVNVEATRVAFNHFFEADLEPILIKGWSLLRFYDNDRFRAATDVDLAFAPAVETAARNAFNDFHAARIAIDVHIGLRGLEMLPWSDIFEHSYVVDLSGVPIRVLADEDNLRLTAVHWLTDGGVNKERLWDIFYLVKNRKADFDWDRCLGSNGPIRKTWVLAAIATARDHLSMDVSGLPIEAQDFQLPDWYKKTLEKEWERGPYIRRVMSTVITKPKLLFEQLQRRFPPNRIAASIDTETPIDNTSRIPAQVKSLTHKIRPFARGLGQRLTYKRQKHDR